MSFSRIITLATLACVAFASPALAQSDTPQVIPTADPSLTSAPVAAHPARKARRVVRWRRRPAHHTAAWWRWYYRHHRHGHVLVRHHAPWHRHVLVHAAAKHVGHPGLPKPKPTASP